ncbi:MAG: hypothetical protein ACI8QC_000370 [Planctomycetota bacterium]|jgi:hypothetical protein
MLRHALLGLLLLGACVSPVTQPVSAPIDLLLQRVAADKPLVGGDQGPSLRNPTCLVRPLRERQLDRLLAIGHERALIQALFAPGAGDHAAHADLLDGLRALHAATPTPERAALIESLSLPFAWRRAEDLSAAGEPGEIRISVSHWNVPTVSLAQALRSTAGAPQEPTRALLESALQLLDL